MLDINKYVDGRGSGRAGAKMTEPWCLPSLGAQNLVMEQTDRSPKEYTGIKNKGDEMAQW